MSAAHVQSLASREQRDAAQTTTVLQPSAKSVTSGNVIVVGWGGGTGVTVSGVTDNLGNTYSHAERKSDANTTGDLWYAPVTSAGSITAITITHGSDQYRGGVAAEFSGIDAASMAVGAGTTGAGSPATWMTSKTIPANGLAVGMSGGYSNNANTAGSASGSPSTTIVLSIDHGANSGYWTGALCYAIAGGSNVTGFNGTTAGPAGYWSAAGALFSPSVTTPTWTTPADTVSMSTTPELKFTSPVSAVKQHFYMQLDTANTFGTGNLRSLDSSTSQTNWTYWDGSAWQALPSDGLPIAKSGNEVCYTVTSALSSATWYRRVRAGTLV